MGAALPPAERRFAALEEAPPPPAIARIIERVAGLLAGARDALDDVELDLGSASAFDRAVYAATRQIPPGEVRSYGEVAKAIGSPGAAQAVGLALGRNPIPIIVPCHRVLAAGGRSGGFSAPGGVGTKFRLLEIEGARRRGEPGLFESLPLAVKRP